MWNPAFYKKKLSMKLFFLFKTLNNMHFLEHCYKAVYSRIRIYYVVAVVIFVLKSKTS